MSLNAPYTPNTVIQSTQVGNDIIGLANGSNDTAANSIVNHWTDDFFDHVASGCVWSGDSYGSTRNASQTAGVIYLTGVRLTVASVTGRAFTASKDTYIDVNSSGVQVYTEVTNNSASPALTAGNIRIGIIITGASNIANSGSVNQGQETIVLPIASSVPYTVTDSLGNLICSRDPTHRIIGYRQSITNFSTASVTAVQYTGLSVPIIIPTGRKVRIHVKSSNVTSSSGGMNPYLSIWDGTVGSGTQLYEDTATAGGTAFAVTLNAESVNTLAAGAHTINAGGKVSTVTGTYTNASTVPAFIKVELV